MRRAAVVLAAGLLAGGCEAAWHDAFGPAERLARKLVNGWDMWQQPSVRPYEPAMPGMPEGIVPALPAAGPAAAFGEARRAVEALEPEAREAAEARAWRRFCHHCHGAHGDGRIIVGESFAIRPADVRGEDIQAMDDETLFDSVRDGTGAMLSLRATVTPAEALLAIGHLRRLKGAPSRPFYPPVATTPKK